MIALWVGVAEADGCAPVGAADLEAHLSAAEAAYTALDGEGLAAALDGFSLDLPCLAEAVTPALAARWHRDLALLAWGEGREADARAELAALARLQPGVPLPLALVPDGHALHGILAESHPAPPVAVPPAAHGELSFDGIRAPSRPAEPTVFQWVDGAVVRRTERLKPGAPLPDYDHAGREPAPDGARRRHWEWVAVAGGAGALSLAGAGLAAHGFHTWEPGPTVSGDDAYAGLVARQRAATGLSAVAIAGFAAAGALVVIPW